MKKFIEETKEFLLFCKRAIKRTKETKALQTTLIICSLFIIIFSLVFGFCLNHILFATSLGILLTYSNEYAFVVNPNLLKSYENEESEEKKEEIANEILVNENGIITMFWLIVVTILLYSLSLK